MKSPSILLIDPEAIKIVMVKNFKNFHDNAFGKMVFNFLFILLCLDFIHQTVEMQYFLDFQTDKDVDPIFGRNPVMLRGEEWKEKRAEITPAFTPNRVSL